jgi:hypothetical protein
MPKKKRTAMAIDPITVLTFTTMQNADSNN